MQALPSQSLAAGACPRCGTAMALEAAQIRCKACKVDYPYLANLPCLFPEPKATLGDWRNRWQLALADVDFERNRAKRALQQATAPATRARLDALIHAYAVHVQSLQSLLQPLGGFATDQQASQLALRTRMPSHHRLLGYEANVFRDWVWGEAENAASLHEVQQVLPEQSNGLRVLILGAGAGRLCADLHDELDDAQTTALDSNPYLALIADRMWQGQSLQLVEFPLAPRSHEDSAKVQQLVGRRPKPGLQYHLGNALRPPFAAKSFDVVLTPWLIDVIDAPAGDVLPRINRLLRPGGCWINHGSMVFGHADPGACHSLEELREAAVSQGFAEGAHRETELPYLASPHSRHRRMETVCTTRWDKVTDGDKPDAYQSLPDWLVTGRDPVPRTQEFELQAQTTRVHAFIMSLIDGRRSLRDMAQIMEEQGLMSRKDAQVALRGFVLKMFEEAAARRSR